MEPRLKARDYPLPMRILFLIGFAICIIAGFMYATSKDVWEKDGQPDHAYDMKMRF